MAADDRVREHITLRSPDFEIFNASWIGNPIVKEKQLATFKIPGIKGEQVQDLEVGAHRQSMSIIFYDPESHDLEATRFWDAADQKGQWEIIHPVLGQQILQLVRIERSIRPIDDAWRTVFALEWIEPANILTVSTLADLQGQLFDLSFLTNNALVQTLSEIKETAFAAVDTFIQAINEITDAVNSVLGPIAATVTEINDKFLQTQVAIQDLLAATILQPTLIAQNIIDLIELPAQVSNDFKSRFESYTDLAQSLFDSNSSDEPVKRSTVDSEFNKSISNQLAISSMLVTSSNIIATSEFETKSETLDASDKITNITNDTIENLEDVQELYKDFPIESQYFANLTTHNNLLRLASLAKQLLLRSLFDLRIEKKFVLDRDRSPIDIVAQEFGGFGENDINLDLFISANKLKGDDILLIPAGREVVINV